MWIYIYFGPYKNNNGMLNIFIFWYLSNKYEEQKYLNKVVGATKISSDYKVSKSMQQNILNNKFIQRLFFIHCLLLKT